MDSVVGAGCTCLVACLAGSMEAQAREDCENVCWMEADEVAGDGLLARSDAAEKMELN